MWAALHFLQLALVVDLLLGVVFDVVEGEDVVVLLDARHRLLAVDVLQRLEDAAAPQLPVPHHHHLVDLLLTVLPPALLVLLLLLLHPTSNYNCSTAAKRPPNSPNCFFVGFAMFLGMKYNSHF